MTVREAEVAGLHYKAFPVCTEALWCFVLVDNTQSTTLCLTEQHSNNNTSTTVYILSQTLQQNSKTTQTLHHCVPGGSKKVSCWFSATISIKLRRQEEHEQIRTATEKMKHCLIFSCEISYITINVLRLNILWPFWLHNGQSDHYVNMTS